MSENIKINIRQGTETNMVLEVSTNYTILEVKQKISEQIENRPAPTEMKLIYKGRMLLPFR
jgi:Ubiquitin family